jgi:hypothetical protein
MTGHLTTECKNCHRTNELISDKGLCRVCTNNSLISMRCLSSETCGHKWQSPGLAAYCPLCGSVNVTSDDKTVDTWLWKMEAKKAGVEFLGIQKSCVNEYPDMPLFLDLQTKTSFTPHKGETLAQAVERKRREFIRSPKIL